MYIIVGLGNIGREYVLTRHNIGFMVIDALAAKYGVDVCREHHKAVFGEGRTECGRVILAKPTTFMNNSGLCVRELVNWYKCEPHELLLIYDDIDLAVGDIRIREKGSAGTHNGMRSVIYHLGIDDFPRIRVGIGKPSDGRDLMYHVLSTPNDTERAELNQAVCAAATAADMIVHGRLLEAQAQFNKKKSQPKRIENDSGNTES